MKKQIDELSRLKRQIRWNVLKKEAKEFLFGWHPTGEEKFAMIAVSTLCIILAIGAVGSKLYVGSAKHPEGDREAASRQAVYTWDGFEPSLDKILKERGET